MKVIILLSFLVVVFVPLVAVAEDVPAVENERDDINYSYGYQLGRELSETGVEVRTEILYQGLFDALHKVEPEMPREEIVDLLETLQKEVK